MAALAAGHSVFEYRIDKVLGGGGFGITYLAQDINLQLPVAIKEYFPANWAVRAPDQSVHARSTDWQRQFDWGLQRFVDEARVLATFRHHSIVRVLRYFQENGTAYIVMDYESGAPLTRWIAEHQGLDQRSLLKFAYPLLDGLETVHKLNFLHRDIKPDNIYIRSDGSPVLLDFGAARRVTTDHDMTNIVSRGFAPFEQYHSKGNQGPWTDLYSLGAVMYWMTTGTKPMESAARVQADTMPKAVHLASKEVFGEQVLQAIDWALAPHENQRPQAAADLRDAFRQSENLGAQAVVAYHLAGSALRRSAGDVTSVPVSAAPDSSRKSVIGTVMFADMVAHSSPSVEQQQALHVVLMELANKAAGGTDASSRIMVDSADGVAICFLEDPQIALQSALLLRDLTLQKYGRRHSIRIGLHTGPLSVLTDADQRTLVVGEGVDVAQCVQDFALTNQITASGAYFDLISRTTDAAEGMFEFLGTRLDKRQRLHDVYSLVALHAVRQIGASQTRAFGPTRKLDAEQGISVDEVAKIETDLMREIGPLAPVLVRKALPKALDAQNLRELLAAAIQNEAAREAFIHPKTVGIRLAGSANVTNAGTYGVRARNSGSDSVVFSKLLGQSFRQAFSRPQNRAASVSAGGGATSQLTPLKVHTFSAEQQLFLERLLSQHIGPLAKTLVRKEADRQLQWDDLVQALAREIDQAKDRGKFVAAASKAPLAPF